MTPAPTLSREPTFLAFLPVLCAVWADGLMEDDELDAVNRALDGAEWMTPEGRPGCVNGWIPAIRRRLWSSARPPQPFARLPATAR